MGLPCCCRTTRAVVADLVLRAMAVLLCASLSPPDCHSDLVVHASTLTIGDPRMAPGSPLWTHASDSTLFPLATALPGALRRSSLCISMLYFELNLQHSLIRK